METGFCFYWKNNGLQIQGGRSVVVVKDHALIVEGGCNPALSDLCGSICLCNAKDVEVVVDKLSESSSASLIGKRDGVFDVDIKLHGLCREGVSVVISFVCPWSKSIGNAVGGEGLIPKNLELRTVDGVERRVDVDCMKEVGRVASVKLDSVSLKVLNNHDTITITRSMQDTGVTSKSKSSLDLDLPDGDLQPNALRRRSSLDNAMENCSSRLSLEKGNEKPSLSHSCSISVDVKGRVDGLVNVEVLLLPTRTVAGGKLRNDVGECTRSVRSCDLVGVVRRPNSISSGGQIELSNPSRVVLGGVHGVLTYERKRKMIWISVFFIEKRFWPTSQS